MIIFLAALLDVPKHLYESARLDGAGAWQRLRWVTLPSISPVILFAVVIGVIEALQLLHAGLRGGDDRRAGPAARPATSTNDLGYPRGLDAVLPGAALPAGLPLLQHGLRGGDGGAAAVRRRSRSRS